MPSDTETSSSGDDGPHSDPKRCAELYNALIHTGFGGSGKAEKGHRLQRNWFEVWRFDPCLGKCREAFTPQFTAFLEQVDVQVKSDGTPAEDDIALVYHLQPISSPGLMLNELHLSLLKDNDFDNMAFLFPSNIWNFSHRLGTFLEMDSMLIWYIPTMGDVRPDEAMWFTLEEYLEELHVAVCFERYGPVHWKQDSPNECILPGWMANPWTDHILEDTLTAYQNLVQAIAKRLPAGTANGCFENESLAMPSELPSDMFGFPRAFLTRAKRPRFKYIAPGLTVYDPSSPTSPLPTKGPDSQVYQTSNRDINNYFEVYHCPVALFPAEATNEEVSESNVRPGLWILPGLEWADEVTLVLPYKVQDPRKEHGERYSRPSTIQLFQHVECPFYAPHRTFLATMLRRWTELVESGIWKVNSDGVEGGIEFYRQADEEEKRNWFEMGVC